MRKPLATLSLMASLMSTTAQAGDDPLYDATPDWVEEADLETLLEDEDAPAELLRDWQYRIEDGVVVAYHDVAIRIDNPQALMAQNTQTLTWLPDKGDLTVHRFEIHREGEVIDLVARGVTFDVLRRERGLEQRLLDGQLTASVSVPGLREGDVLRIAHSVSTDDQALGDEVQATQFLRSEPWQVGFSRAVMSWPADEEMFWRAEDRVELTDPVEEGGFYYLTVDLPLTEPDPMPADAPYRFRRPPVLRVGSFDSWNELSRVMLPHFEQAAQLSANSPIRDRAAEIMAETSDPRARTAMAVRLVQDEISYLLNGLDGGNYLPQSADETWDIRYGDCKAKSVLLLSLLREMGIASEVVLVSSRAGDAVPELLPLPAAFDHMIVRAEIDGVEYWLDGTSAGTRLANLADVPPFHYALPLREGGADLVPMMQRDLAQPQMAMSITMDQSAGVDWPAPMSMVMTMTGPVAAQMQAMADADDPDQLRMIARQFSSGGEMQASSIAISYDSEAAIGTITITGLAPTSFEWRDGRLRTNDNTPDAPTFNPDRSRAAWRDIPVATGGPSRTLVEAVLVLPQEGEGFSFDGEPSFSADIANMRVTGFSVIEDGVLSGRFETFETLGEVAAADVAAVKREARRYDSIQNEILPPDEFVWRWELSDAERSERAASILELIEEAVLFADEDDYAPRRYRIWFNRHIYAFEDALPDLDFLIEEEASASLHAQRAHVRRLAGYIDAAIEDRRIAYDLDPSGYNGRQLADMLALVGELDEAMAITRELPVPEDEEPSHAYQLAVILGLSGDLAAGEAVMADMIEDHMQDSNALNLSCWYSGLYLLQLDSALERCTQAVERAEFAAGALDSRALVHFRRGDYDAAIADLDAALLLSPELGPAHYLRGVVRLHAGDEGGADDIRHGTLMLPYIAEEYAQFGIAPPE